MPDWPAHDSVRAVFTTRSQGFSESPYQSFNLGTHVGDESEVVEMNRHLLRELLPSDPLWLNQIHSSRCIDVHSDKSADREADAAVTDCKSLVLAVMAADCLPVLVCTRDGSRIGVIHAGWRGLARDIIGQTLRNRPGDWIAWLGAGIGPCHYEVGEEVRREFDLEDAFERRSSSWMMDLYRIAREQLTRAGVSEIYGGDCCTYCDVEKFYSYRRDGKTGRMAGFIWLT